MRVYLDSLGCRMNAAEIEALARRFAGSALDGMPAAPWQVVMLPEEADVLVLNTCAVTQQAVRKSRHRIHALHRANPQAQIAVLGCWATEDAPAIARLPGVTWVLPNARERTSQPWTEKARAVTVITGESRDPAPWVSGQWGHTRAFLGVQDGCDYTCTYCITRVLRGPAHSRPLTEVVRAIQELVAAGAQEVVLTGVCLGAYGKDLGLEEGVAALVAAVLADTDVPRLRLSSIEPWDVMPSLLRQWENPRLCPQLHLPLQAGVDALLRRMGRRITTAAFARLAAEARAIAPDVALTTDVIVGFPGETEALFAESLDFVAALAFARLHVFPYSERDGTAAVHLSGRIPQRVRRERAKIMRALGNRLAADYRQRFLGRVLPVLWEHQDVEGRQHGLTGNYLSVVMQSSLSLVNCIVDTQLVALEGNGLRGEISPDALTKSQI